MRVCAGTRERKFYAAIKISGRSKSLGTFDSEREAAKAYDAAAGQYFGDFAICNFPPEFPKFCLAYRRVLA